ncbi:hypothetical protein GGX14DRAFT_528825 [Mycena pura]|uniref:DUF6699 domain-containing protein n=1 Tax=Mycena pura TaxID=153505 RepID=A0AAD6XZ07_9AGAR|nr:hypothetical protein GGX14DRAFT_528825 [Mycena pura]
MSPKQVHWKLTVDEYAARDSPESWSAPLPNQHRSQRETIPSAALASPPPLPPAPRPQRNLALPPSLTIHPLLAPAYALQLDFSFPSAAFRGNPQLTEALLDTPACTPPQKALVVRIASGQYKTRLEIRHTGGGAVTVGDVLTQIQNLLRQYDTDKSIPPEAAPYAARRVATVNGFCAGVSARTQQGHVRAEHEGGPRIVDRLLGHTLFAGLTVMLGQQDHHWQLELAIPQRYAA